MALQTAIAEFDHDEDWKHDEELDLHADKILFQKLALCFLSDPGSEEVAMICTALEMVYRASRQRIALSFSELRESVLPIFVHLLNQPLRFRKLEQLEQAVTIEAAKKRSPPSYIENDRLSVVHEKNIRRESMDDSATKYNDLFKNQNATYEDDPTNETYDNYPKKTKMLDDNDSYATYDDEFPKKSIPTDDDHNSYATYDDDYPKKSKDDVYKGNHSFATEDDSYAGKGKSVNDIDDDSYATYDTALMKATEPYTRTKSDHQGNDSRSKKDLDDESTQDDDPQDRFSARGEGESNRLLSRDQRTRATTGRHDGNTEGVMDSMRSYIDERGNDQDKDDTTALPNDQYEVETVMSEGSYGNSLGKPKASNDQRKNDDNISEYTEYTQQNEHVKNKQRDDATIYTADGAQTIIESKHEGDLDTIGEGSRESDNQYSQSFTVENAFSHNQAFALPGVQPTRVTDAQSVKTVSTHAQNLKEKKRQQEQRENAVIQQLEAELELIRFDAPTHPIAIGRSLQVLRYFSRVLSAMVQLAHHPGMLDALVYQLERQPYGKYKQHFYEHPNGEPRLEEEMDELQAARIDAIATIVNLACAEENKCKIANHRGLLDSVTSVAQNDDSEEAREHAAIVIMNLAYEDENKVCRHLHPRPFD